MKKILSVLIIICLIPLSGCGNNTSIDDDKIRIVATLFPQYDFARQIGGDLVSVSLLLPAGQDSHHYDPTPSDMLMISKSDLFVYTGDEMEPWASDIASSIGDGVEIVNASDGIWLSQTSHVNNYDEDHAHSYDPHIWLDIDNAIKMCENICTALSDLSPENTEFFTKNFESYKAELLALDEKYKEAFENTEKELVFGGKFALGYLVSRYDIHYKSAYDSCSANSEPSIQDIASLSNFVKENDIKAVFCEEYTDPKVAREIALSNSAEVLVVHSCHNISREERDNNITFIDLMTQNLENLRKGL